MMALSMVERVENAIASFDTLLVTLNSHAYQYSERDIQMWVALLQQCLTLMHYTIAALESGNCQMISMAKNDIDLILNTIFAVDEQINTKVLS